MTKPATGGLVVTGKTTGPVALAISTNAGQSWQDAGTIDGAFEKDLTDLAKGRYGWQLRFILTESAGLDAVTFTTVCQMSQAIYPRLKPGGSRVTYRSATRAVVPVVPDFGLSEQQIAGVEAKDLRSANLKYTPRSAKQRLAYTTTNNKPGQVVFNVAPPGELLEISAAARFQVRVPPPQGCDFRMEVSVDGGKSWQPLAKAELPADNEYSSGWVYGRAPIKAPAKSALIRINLFAGGFTTGLIATELYGVHRTPPPHPCKVTYAWKEAGQGKTHDRTIAAGANEQAFTVPTGAAIVDDFIRIAVP